MIVRDGGGIRGWLESKLGCTFADPCEVIGILDRTGRPIGAALFNDRSCRNIELTVYGPGAFRRDVCRQIAAYCFDQMRCERITVRTRYGNEKVRAIIERFGWKPEGILRNFYGDDDAVIYGMLRTECRFLN